MITYKPWWFVLVLCRLATSQNLPALVLGGPLSDDPGIDVPGPPVTDAELEASLLDASLLEPPPEESPIATQTQHFQGDIILQTEDELYEILLNNETQAQNDAIANPDRKWPNAVIPYLISSSFSKRDRAVIVRAIAEFKKKTCIRLTPRTSQIDYVHIIRGQGCYSSIGRVRGGQTLSLGDNCVYFGTVVHELMHAAGFWHEQSRYDRDDYVTINWSNIIDDLEYNFEKKTRSVTKDLGLSYDFESVMHYSQYAFAINPQIPTIYPKQNGQKILGQRKGFSALDVKGLNLLYECGGEPIPKPSGCVDTNAFCSDWARKGECAKNSAYMHDYCKKSCNKCGTTTTTGPSQEFIPISNIVDHGGFRPGGAGPENLLQNEGYWNPNPKPWFVVFDLGKSHAVTSFQATNFGDTTHDMTAFKLESSEDLESWTQVKTVDNVKTGTSGAQIFKLSGTGRFWRFTVTATAEGFQPFLKRVAFFGFPMQCWSESNIPCSSSGVPEGKNFPHPEYCNKFIKCSGGKAIIKTCSRGKLFNHRNGFCSKTSNVCFCGVKTTRS
ncbi:unnamed protein product [Meganyctiphanes norvegica]|uniref:Metalloendopeptidase n=1 Tax=Meganyctiphanes norvegica TaxID=48144 RepID=A0AAV2PUE9_MEGNR